jgi:hypothetical protein
MEADRRVVVARWVAVVAGAVVAAALGLRAVSVEGPIGPGQVSVRGAWGGSDTTIVVPPLGDVVFDTHRVPLALQARIETIDPEAAQRLATDRQAIEGFDESAGTQLRSLLVQWAWRAALVMTIAGALAGALLWPGRIRPALVGGAVGLVVTVALLGGTWTTFDREDLRDPEYHGALQRAPEVLAAIDRNWGGVERIPGRLRALAGNITELYATAADAGSGTAGRAESDEVRILHVSDVHSNPVGLELARGLAEGFAVDAIVDTGDLTSFGLPVEARIGTLLSSIPVPYYFIPGNHDSRANRAALDAYPNVTLVDGTPFTVGNLRLLGFADPAVTANREDSDPEADAARDRQAPGVASAVRRERPDVLAVASTRQAADVEGLVPLVISGNVHRRTDTTRDGTRFLTVGSTGATGIGAFTEPGTARYEAQILRFRDRRLAAIDYVTFAGTGGDYTVSRTVVPDEP